jgi:hypothetical protein
MKFICDNMLGKLAKWLRIVGYDTSYYSFIEDKELIEKALKENRIILTRDTQIVKQKKVVKYVFIESDYVIEQLNQIVKELNINITENKLFSICLICNKKLSKVKKEEVKQKVPTYVYQTKRNFAFCSQCRRVYWKGTHFENVIKRLKEELKIE